MVSASLSYVWLETLPSCHLCFDIFDDSHQCTMFRRQNAVSLQELLLLACCLLIGIHRHATASKVQKVCMHKDWIRSCFVVLFVIVMLVRCRRRMCCALQTKNVSMQEYFCCLYFVARIVDVLLERCRRRMYLCKRIFDACILLRGSSSSCLSIAG